VAQRGGLTYTPGMTNPGQLSDDFLAVATENVELRQQLADVQDQCVELAVDAGELHAEIEALRVQLAAVERERDAWRAEAEWARRTG
jgi:septal ring factor EnvC (AmiA/AmiB activator)